MPDQKYKILFLSLRNSVRSLMAEAVTNHLGKGRFVGASAGLEPQADIDALSREVLRTAEIPFHGLRPQALAGIHCE